MIRRVIATASVELFSHTNHTCSTFERRPNVSSFAIACLRLLYLALEKILLLENVRLHDFFLELTRVVAFVSLLYLMQASVRETNHYIESECLFEGKRYDRLGCS